MEDVSITQAAHDRFELAAGGLAHRAAQVGHVEDGFFRRNDAVAQADLDVEAGIS